MYTGLAPGYSQEIGNCLVFIGVGIGHSVQFVVSEYISAEANLFVFLIISVTAVHLFVVADSHFGSGSSSRRSCCSRKHDENSKTVNGQPEVLTELAGNATQHLHACICSCLLWYIGTACLISTSGPVLVLPSLAQPSFDLCTLFQSYEEFDQSLATQQ